MAREHLAALRAAAPTKGLLLLLLRLCAEGWHEALLARTWKFLCAWGDRGNEGMKRAAPWGCCCGGS